MAQALLIAKISSGPFDVTVWPQLRLWGADSEKPQAPAPKDLEKALKLVDYSSVALTDVALKPDILMEKRLAQRSWRQALQRRTLIQGHVCFRAEQGPELIESLAGVEALVVFVDDAPGELKWQATSQLMTKLIVVKNKTRKRISCQDH